MTPLLPTRLAGLLLSLFQLTSWDRVQDPFFSALKSEWWYTIGFVNGTNQAGAPRHFAFMVSVVRAADYYKSPLPVVFAATDLEISLLDLDQHTHVTSDVATGFPDYGSFTVKGATRGNDGAGGALQDHFVGSGSGFSVDLTVQPVKPQAAFGDGGVVDNDSLGNAVYVSRTRQQVMAPSVIHVGDETVNVTGLAWEDHQLSDIRPFANPIRWNWFAVLLTDGTEVMAYQIVDAASGALLKNYAGHVHTDGSVDNLDGQFVVTETASSPYDEVDVPTAWDVSLPGIFKASGSWIVPLPDIVTSSGDVKGAYFEGPCDVTGDDGKVAALWAEHFDGRLYSGVTGPRI